MTVIETIALLAAVTALSAMWTTIVRLRRTRTRHALELAECERSHGEELDNARHERNAMLDALTDAFFLIDGSARIIFANTAAHELCGGRALHNRPTREIFTDPRLVDALARCLESEEPQQARVTLPQQAFPKHVPDHRGTNAWIIDSAKIATTGGRICTCLFIRDITPEYQTEQIRKDFVANASHELRTPMAIISGYLENLLDNDMLEDPELARRFLNVMRKHSDRMSRIIEDMLVISRLESGDETQLNIEPFELRPCIHDIIERLESVIQAHQAAITIDIPNDPPFTLHGDRFYLFQALFNLIENALKQNPRPGLAVTIGARCTDNTCEVWIIDNGVGIPRADLPYIFRRFYRVDKQHSQREIKGTGLGLSIVKRAIEAHGGTITASSTPGTETKFLIRLPQAPATTAAVVRETMVDA